MKKILFLVICMGLVSTQLFAQVNNRITGKVTDEDKAPVVGVAVTVVGKNAGTTTDAKGHYSINAAKGETLRFTYIGMEEKRVKVENSSVIDVTLKSDALQIEEVVAIGYGSMRKSDLTGAVGSIKGSQMMESSPVSISQGLQGRMAGVMVQQVDGAPGSGVSIEVRGANSFTGGTQPLYVVDDIPYESNSAPGATANDLSATNPLSMINPNDIESIEVLKDASATAIYGSRGANGVVLIRTKQGKAGKAKIDVSFNQGWSVVNRTINVLDAYAYARMNVESRINSTLYDVETSYLAQNNVNYLDVFGTRTNFKDAEYYRNRSTDWQDMIFKTGRVSDATLSLSGGSDKMTYMVSTNFVDQAGILKSSGYRRAGMRINLQGKISSRIKFGVSTNFSWDNNRFVRTGSDVGQQGGAIKSALRYPPVYNAYTEVGDVADEWYDASNPLTYVLSQKNNVVNFKNTISGYIEGKLQKNLTLRVRVGSDYGTATRHQYLPIGVRESKTGQAYYRQNQHTKIVNENVLTYHKDFNEKHRLDVVGGFTWEVGKSTYRENSATSFINDALEDNAMQTASDVPVIRNGRSKSTLASFLGRVNYTLLDCYIFTVSGRADGSSKFAVNNKWAFFPSAAVAWRLSEEPFMKNNGVFDNLKIRFSYGETGNQGISSYSSMTSMNSMFYAFEGTLYTGAAIGSDGLGNDNLTWETTRQINGGIDIGVLNNRLSLTVDLYKKKTTSLLQQQEIPLSRGYSKRWMNLGSMENKGIEVTLNATPIARKNFTWDLSFNIYRNMSKILSLGPGIPSQTVSKVATNVEPFKLIVGSPLGDIWALRTLGIYQNIDQVKADGYWAGNDAQEQFMVGEFRYFKPDGGTTPPANGTDAVVVGNTNPKFMFGFNNSFSIGRFDVSFFFQGSYGNDIVNMSKWDMLKNIGGSSSNITWEAYNNLWRGEGTSNKYPKAVDSKKRLIEYFSDTYVEDGSYIKLKSLNIGYNFDLGRWSKFIKNLKISFVGTNLFCITNYSGYDPEVNAFNTDPRKRGVDMGNYPGSATFSVNLQATF